MGNCRENDGTEGMKVSKKAKVCNVCGHRGFSVALLYCSKCSDSAVHQYCLGIPPGSVDDTFDWYCEYCSPSTECEQYDNAIVHVEEGLIPLHIMPPSPQHESSEKAGSISPVEIASGVILLASLYGEISIQDTSLYSFHLVSNLDKPIEKYGDVEYDCEQGDPNLGTNQEIDSGHSDEDAGFSNGIVEKNISEDGDVRRVIVFCLPAFGTEHRIKRKRRLTLVKLDLIPSIGPECKRARSKRGKMSSVSKMVNDTLNDQDITQIKTSLDEQKPPFSNYPFNKDRGQQSEKGFPPVDQGLRRREPLYFACLPFSSTFVPNDDPRSRTQTLSGSHELAEKPKVVVMDKIQDLKESVTYQDALKEYDVEIQKLMISLEDERKNREEVVKKNRRKMWKAVYELESTKKELHEKKIELAKKNAEVKILKNLAFKEHPPSIDNKEAYELWSRGYSDAQNDIYQLHPELNWDCIKAVGNLTSRYF